MSEAFTRILLALRRTTSSGRFLPEIDGVRFLSISWVVLFHTIGQVTFKFHQHLPDSRFWQIIGAGDFGVWIFFCLSGFVLALPFAEWRTCGGKPVRLKRYYLRRLTRIEPPYLVNLTSVFVLLPLLARSHRGYVQEAKHLVASAFYLHGLLFHRTSSLNPVAWSLEIEAQFYLLAPCLALLFLLKSTPVRRLALLTAIALLGFTSGLLMFPIWRNTLVPFLPYFLAGFYVADLYCTSWNRAPRRQLRWDLVTILTAVGILIFLLPPVNTLHYVDNSFRLGKVPLAFKIFLPFLLIPFLVGAFRSRIFQRFMTLLPVTVIGGMCYTIYLYHLIIIAAITRPLFKLFKSGMALEPQLWITLALAIPAVVVLSAVLFALIEKPFMNFGAAKKTLVVRLAHLHHESVGETG
ncbi:MAG: acyltransferase [Bryobacterales bacterium]|nr:acyltransferase [Bryobacterales bacterium]MBV9397893.1 acyltransferase [Bryobacterales bacterium]